MKWTRAAPLLFLVLVGCVKTRIEEVKTGLFDDDPEKMMKAYEKVKVGETTQKQLEEIGFKLNAPNVDRRGGVDVMEALFQGQSFQGVVTDFVKCGKGNDLFQELNRYEMVRFPYKYIETKTDRIYFSNQETTVEGKDYLITIVLKDGLVVYAPPARRREIKEKFSDGAFLEGIVEFLNKYGKFGSNIREWSERIREWINKNRDNE
jgi:hypothetical protein